MLYWSLKKKTALYQFWEIKKALTYIKNNLFDSKNKMYFTINSLIDINNLIIGWNNITLEKLLKHLATIKCIWLKT